MLLAMLFFVLTIILFFNYYFDLDAASAVSSIGRVGLLLTVLTGNFSLIDNSSGGRIGTWIQTLNMIYAHPMGVGLGGWSSFVIGKNTLTYPHSMFLEMWSEGGIILGTLACFPLLIFFFAKRNIFWFIALVLFIAQMVSGDIGDARQMYVFSLMAALSLHSRERSKSDLK